MSQIIFLGTGGGPTPGVVLTLTGNNPVAVPPDGLGNINVVGDGVTIDVFGDAGTNTLTISAIGGTGVLTLTGDAGGAVSPVAGNIDVPGDRNMNTLGNTVPGELEVRMNNNIFLGDLSTITANNDALTAVSGDITLQGTGVNAAGNINLRETFTTGTGAYGVINLDSNVATRARFIHATSGISPTNSVYVGLESGNFTTTSQANTGIGYQALNAIGLSPTANRNTAVGAQSMRQAVNAEDCVAVGIGSMDQLISGQRNTCLGGQSGVNLLTGSNNILVDYNAGFSYNAAETNNINIGNQGVVGDNNTIRIGRLSAFGTQNPHTSAYMAGVAGVTVSNQEMVVIDTTTGQLGSEPIGTGAVLTLTGNTGGAVPPTAGNINIINTNTTVPIIGIPGTSTLTQDYSLRNLIFGTNPVGLPGDTATVAIGYRICEQFNLGGNNVLFGDSTIPNATTIVSTVAIGTESLSSASSSVQNTAIGFGTLRNLVNGNNNIAVGHQAGLNIQGSQSRNICIGSVGSVGENNTTRIGTTFQQTRCFIAGVNSNTLTGPFINISASTDQLAVTSMTSDSSGRVTNASQPLFSVYNNNAIVNVTGDNTIYTIIFDTTDVNQGSVYNAGTGTFTAPITGRYLFGLTCTVSNLSSGHNEGKVFIVTTPRTYTGNWVNPFVVSTAGAGIYTFTTSVLVSLTASQTAQFQVQVSNSTKTVNVAGGIFTYAYGYLVA